MDKRTIQADVLIVGGGMIGLTQALALASAGLRSVVVERQKPSVLTAMDHDGRVSTLSYGSAALYGQVGAWEHMADHAAPIEEIRVADNGAPLFLHFDHREVGDRPFGFTVENRYIRLALHCALAKTEQAQLIAPGELTSLDRDQAGVRGELADGRRLTAALVIGAEGRHSPLREAAGIRCLSWQYDQTAIVTTVRHEGGHGGIASELFLPAGPFALLPMRGNRSALIWTERGRDVAALLALDEAAFNGEIMERAGGHWGRIECDAPRWSYPLGLQNAERYIDTRLALIGDAAHGMHPVAGQGLNLGIRDVAALAEVLTNSARLGLDPGGGEPLRRYQHWRRFDALTMLMMTDGLVRLFSNDITPLRLARVLGLGLVNRIGPAKRFFERHAAAMTGDLPKLIRGEAL
ncbi:MAG: UbiH/UbiF/VisC/COQ6 family ubiquinone biosynthesis hydroxylase [Alphaproteobacteria bacterium]|mgnify:CR=1 FL=1|nr:UbiH/UbiF/VisC/COQ6 family ubiquinone biosynthesis hydroxylase [Alphaproteobacteria bacterium]